MLTRERLFEIVEKSDANDRPGVMYDLCMIAFIVISLIPLAFKQDNTVFIIIDKVCVAVFIVDYILRWMTADYKFEEHAVKSFVRYPFSFMALVDLISILPSLSIVNNSLKMFRVLRMVRACRVFRVFKAVRYSRSIEIIGNVLKSSKKSLVAVCMLAGGYILVAALVIFNVEPESFNTFFDAVYWATVSLTTVGYGDIYPVSTMGRMITMLSSIFGIAIVALPAGIITAGYMTELNREAVLEEEKEPTPHKESESDRKEKEKP